MVHTKAQLYQIQTSCLSTLLAAGIFGNSWRILTWNNHSKGCPVRKSFYHETLFQTPPTTFNSFQFSSKDLEGECLRHTGNGAILEAKKQNLMVEILKFRSNFKVSQMASEILLVGVNSIQDFQDMLSCLLTDEIYAEEQKLISLLGIYVKAATLRLELFEEWAENNRRVLTFLVSNNHGQNKYCGWAAISSYSKYKSERLKVFLNPPEKGVLVGIRPFSFKKSSWRERRRRPTRTDVGQRCTCHSAGRGFDRSARRQLANIFQQRSHSEIFLCDQSSF